jgi:hypothetical protein
MKFVDAPKDVLEDVPYFLKHLYIAVPNCLGVAHLHQKGDNYQRFTACHSIGFY